MKEFYSNGKLLLTGEYAILDGAMGLALPTKFGQYLSVKKSNTGQINWKGLTDENTTWFTADITLKNFRILNTSDVELAERLVSILMEAKQLNPSFLDSYDGVYVDTKLTFPKDWGLGSSSTLINNVANWAQVDPFHLLEATFGGSGYDIACARNDTPLIYTKINGEARVKKVVFDPNFKDMLHFIYLNKKQNSRDAIKRYRKFDVDSKNLITKVNELTGQLLEAKTIDTFENVLNSHEVLLSKILRVPTIKDQIFPEYPRSIKSLGAWGGDFIMATGGQKEMEYFADKGYTTVIPYIQMIL